MEQINIHAAKTRLSALVEQAAAGNPFIIAKAGRPLVTVVPYNPAEPNPRVGFMKEKISIPDDFDTMCSEDVQILFEDSI